MVKSQNLYSHYLSKVFSLLSICYYFFQWLSVAKKLRSLTLGFKRFSYEDRFITREMMNDIMKNGGTSQIKILQLNYIPGPEIVLDIAYMEVLKNLESLEINLQNIQIDEILKIISSGCANLKKLKLHGK